MKPFKEPSFLLILLLLLFLSYSRTWANMPGAGQETLTKRIRFEPNLGQTDASVCFLSRGNGYTLFLMPEEVLIVLKNAKYDESSSGSYSSVCMQLTGANPAPHLTGRNILPGITNYYIGNNPDNWHTNIVNYASVEYQDIYPGIDLVYYGNESLLEFDFLVSPGANPGTILMNFNTDEKISIDEKGNLVFSGVNNSIVLKRPVAFQNINDNREPVDAEFALLSNNQVRFVVGDYNPRYPLVIDPVLVFASYLGGSGYDGGAAVAVNESGCAYVAGSTSSSDFPTRNSFQGDLFPEGYSDIFVTKFNADGTDIVFSTYIGGNCYDQADAIAVDKNGQVSITGRTCSHDREETPEYEGFPLLNACQTEGVDDYDAFVTVLDSLGGLVYSTYLGGTYEDYGTDIAVDDNGDVYITGTVFSFDFPIKNAYMDQNPSYYFSTFVTKIDPTKSGDESLIYSTYLGSEYDDESGSIAVDKYGCAYVTGKAKLGFPTTANAIQKEYQGEGDIYVTKFSADGSSLVYSTYLGDTLSNSGRDIVVDDSCCAYVSGSGLPATPGAINNPGSSFLCKLNTSGNGFVYTARVFIDKLAVDKNGNIFGTKFLPYGKGGAIMAFNHDGSDTLFYHEIVVGPMDITLDADTNVYIIASTDSTGLATEGSYQEGLAGQRDAFVMKIHIEPPEMLVVKVMSDPIYNTSTLITNTLLDIYSIDLSNRTGPLTYIESKTTDKKGLLHLPVDRYEPGTPIFVRTIPKKIHAIKSDRTEKTSYMYKVNVDNLILDNDGNISAQLLESDPEDTTLTYLSHTSIGFSLIVSVQWLASQEYISNLVNALIQLNNRLYDVTNGQAFIDTVAIFDNASHWDKADIQIFASNLEWPRATPMGWIHNYENVCVKLPPIWDGSPQSSIIMIYNSDPIDPAIDKNVMTIVHELGHYLFGFYDEYRNEAGNNIFPNINFGFMDSQYNLNDPRSTEMSDYYVVGDIIFENYQQTHQYEFHGRNCWDYFRYQYLGTYGDVAAMIHTPEDLGIPTTGVMKGPNSNILNPDFSVGDMMGFENNATTTTNPRLDVLITVNPAGIGRPIPGAQTKLQKKDMTEPMNHGLTNGAGRIRLFNAEPGDAILATHKDRQFWRYKKIVVSQARKNTENADMIIELDSVSGQFSLLAGLAFDAAGIPVYQCQADPVFATPPSIQVYDDVSASEKQVLSESAGVYSIAINKPDFSQGQVFFSAPDIDGEEFFIFQDATIRDAGEQGIFSSAGLQMEYIIDTSVTTAEKVAFLASAFPAPEKGLPDSVLRASDVISINSFPGDTELKVQVNLHYYADSLEAAVPEALALYKWEDGWVPLESSVDLSHNMVTATIEESGFYAAYLDLTRSRLISHIEHDVKIENETGIRLFASYPNPFDRQTMIKYHLPESAHVVLKIYSPIGQELVTLVNAFQPEGGYEIAWQPEGLPAGLYLYRIVVTDNSSTPGQGYAETGKMMLVR